MHKTHKLAEGGDICRGYFVYLLPHTAMDGLK